MKTLNNVVIFTYTDLPSDIKDLVSDDWRFGNDRYLEFLSELDYTENVLGDEIEAWWHKDLSSGDWNEDEFLEWLWDNNTTDLRLDWWIAKQIGQTKPSLILIKVSW